MTQSQTVRTLAVIYLCVQPCFIKQSILLQAVQRDSENVSSEVSTPERPGVADRLARRTLQLKRSPFVICSANSGCRYHMCRSSRIQELPQRVSQFCSL